MRLVNGEDYHNIDLLCGGSPCQNFSFAGTRKGAVTKDNIEITTLEKYLELKEQGFEFEGQSYLFWEYVRILKEVKPKYFLLENVKMSKKWQDVISNALGVEPIEIDSALVSAQGRKRLYWTNIPNVTQPEDKGIGIEDILEDYNVYYPEGHHDYLNLDYSKIDKSLYKINPVAIGRSFQFKTLVRCDSNKAYTIAKAPKHCGILTEDNKIRPFTITECERLQTLPDGYTNVGNLSDNKRWETVGNGWTIDVIAHIFKNIK